MAHLKAELAEARRGCVACSVPCACSGPESGARRDEATVALAAARADAERQRGLVAAAQRTLHELRVSQHVASVSPVPRTSQSPPRRLAATAPLPQTQAPVQPRGRTPPSEADAADPGADETAAPAVAEQDGGPGAVSLVQLRQEMEAFKRLLGAPPPASQ
jgi:hypothetical protein